MGKRGRKPVDLELLKGSATVWASFLYTLRDGQSGLIQKVKWGPVIELRPDAKGYAHQGSRVVFVGKKPLRYRSSQVILGAKIIPLECATAKFPKLKLEKGWTISPPVLPKPEAWKQLKRARSVEEVRQAGESIRKWERKFGPLVAWRELPKTIHSHANEILGARRLPNYPRTNRPTSDDKRLLFFAKVMAGLTLGIAPATAVKRLGRWRFPKDWAEKPVRDLEARYPMPTRINSGQEGPK